MAEMGTPHFTYLQFFLWFNGACRIVLMPYLKVQNFAHWKIGNFFLHLHSYPEKIKIHNHSAKDESVSEIKALCSKPQRQRRHAVEIRVKTGPGPGTGRPVAWHHVNVISWRVWARALEFTSTLAGFLLFDAAGPIRKSEKKTQTLFKWNVCLKENIW